MSLLDRLRRAPKGAASATAAAGMGATAAGAGPLEHAWQFLDAPGGSHLFFLNPEHVQTGLLDLLEATPRTVLDVGCYCGATGALVRQRWPGSTVIGIEPLPEAADIAATKLDRVIVGRFEEIDFAAQDLAPRSFDAVVLADVLEHMYNPWRALVRLRDLLTDDGVVLASIPNVRNLALVQSLLAGHWTYAGGGLLDVTHIRFFTLSEIRALFAQTGYAIERVEHNVDPSLRQLWESAPHGERMTIRSGPLTVDGMTKADMQELATLQFYVRAAKAG